MEGDLADIFRATGRAITSGCCSDFSESPRMINEEELDPPREYYGFGDPFPFGSVRDPFLVELDGIGGRSSPAPPSFHGGDEMLAAATAPFQISTSTSTSSDLVMSGFTGPMPACSLQGVRGVGDRATTGNRIPPPSSPKPSTQLLDAPRVQICSPTTPIAKRRKSQSKKVVCIPAPTTAANNRQGGGEVVPSDLWAWRKYGQKPIKGSPHPRGYYRCSSSKGCSARKQVERSRTDPNMLVITYTSEHNHPWPTQRNSLAGSTRIPSKPSPTPLPTDSTEPHKAGSIKDESDINSSAADGDHSNNSSIGGDEAAEADGYHQHHNSKGLNDAVVGPDQLMVLNDIMFDNTYYDNPIQYNQGGLELDGYNWDHDLFADLRDMEGDPLNLFFSGARSGFTADFDRAGGSKSMFDPFNNCNLFDWSTSNSNSTTTANRRTHQNS